MQNKICGLAKGWNQGGGRHLVNYLHPTCCKWHKQQQGNDVALSASSENLHNHYETPYFTFTYASTLLPILYYSPVFYLQLQTTLYIIITKGSTHAQAIKFCTAWFHYLKSISNPCIYT